MSSSRESSLTLAGVPKNGARGGARGRGATSLGSRFRRWSRPPRRLRIIREGWVFIVVTLGVGAAAINTGNNLLFLLLGLMLGLIVVSGLMSEATLRNVAVERHLPARMHAETPTLIEVTLKNGKRLLPSYSVELEDILEGWTTDKRCYFLKVAARGRQTAAYRTELPRRGPIRFLGYRVATRYPFGLFEKWREIPLEEEGLVLPRIVAVPRLPRTARERGVERTRGRPGQGEEIHGLREHRPEDDFRSIHWRTSARRGRLMVRENEEEAARRLAIYLDNARRPEVAEGEEDIVVERAISLAASLALERAAKGQAVDLSVRGARGPSIAPGGTPDRLLRFLARLEYADPIDPPPLASIPGGEAVLIADASRAGAFDGPVLVVSEDGGAS